MAICSASSLKYGFHCPFVWVLNCLVFHNRSDRELRLPHLIQCVKRGQCNMLVIWEFDCSIFRARKIDLKVCFKNYKLVWVESKFANLFWIFQCLKKLFSVSEWFHSTIVFICNLFILRLNSCIWTCCNIVPELLKIIRKRIKVQC